MDAGLARWKLSGRSDYLRLRQRVLVKRDGAGDAELATIIGGPVKVDGILYFEVSLMDGSCAQIEVAEGDE